MANNPIIFAWKDGIYTVPTARNPIILPYGKKVYILMFESWKEEDLPLHPGELIEVNYLMKGPGSDLQFIATSFDGVLATRVTIESYVTCPKNCCCPTSPFCSKCGSRTETITAMVPYKVPNDARNTPHVLDGVVPVSKNNCCPNCKYYFDDKTKPEHCPECGQAVTWIDCK